MPEPIKITIISNPAYIRVVRTAAEAFGGRNGFTREQSDQIGLAVNEALANVIEHGYQGNMSKVINITLDMVEDGPGQPAIQIIIRDFGQQVDPDCIKSRELSEIRPGGLGVHIIKTVMDDVAYRCMPEGGMELRMRKHVGAPKEVKR
jgi:serine/threonine-protein kinase RsbW